MDPDKSHKWFGVLAAAITVLGAGAGTAGSWYVNSFRVTQLEERMTRGESDRQRISDKVNALTTDTALRLQAIELSNTEIKTQLVEIGADLKALRSPSRYVRARRDE